MSFFKSKIITFFLLAILIVILIFLYRQYLDKERLGTKVGYLQGKIDSLDKENIDLERQMVDLSSPDKMEGAARKLYVLTKPGEKAFIIPQDLLNIPPELSLPGSESNIFKVIFNFIRSVFK